MLVTADADFVVKQDGNMWSPIGDVGGAAQYIINSNGRLSVLVDGKEVFFFIVSFVSDFEFINNNMYQIGDGTINVRVSGGSNYCQSVFDGRTTEVDFYVQPSSMAVSDLMNLDTFCNQEVSVSKSVYEDVWVRYRLSNLDISSYLQFSVGNVLLGFVCPE